MADVKAQAEDFKAKGNAALSAKDFDGAVAHYSKVRSSKVGHVVATSPPDSWLLLSGFGVGSQQPRVFVEPICRVFVDG